MIINNNVVPTVNFPFCNMILFCLATSVAYWLEHTYRELVASRSIIKAVKCILHVCMNVLAFPRHKINSSAGELRA